MVNVLLVQFDPIYRNPKESRLKVERLIDVELSEDRYQALKLDLIILPEMAFSGYNFKSVHDIKQVALDTEKESIEFAKVYSLKYKCGVAIGYPRFDETSGKYFNSQAVMKPNGEVLNVYNKTHLYYNDKTWASEGSGFKCIELDWMKTVEGRSVKAVQAICMDINPKDFTAPYNEYELASYANKVQADLILFSSAWTSSPDEKIDFNDLQPIQYWANRLKPLLDKKVKFICTNRIGSELNENWKQNLQGLTTFVGRSCVIDLEKRLIIDYIAGNIEACKFISFD